MNPFRQQAFDCPRRVGQPAAIGDIRTAPATLQLHEKNTQLKCLTMAPQYHPYSENCTVIINIGTLSTITLRKEPASIVTGA